MILLVEFLKFCYDFFIPRFIEEDVAIKYSPDGDFSIICCVDDLVPDDDYDGIATSKALVWMWWGFFATISDFRDL